MANKNLIIAQPNSTNRRDTMAETPAIGAERKNSGRKNEKEQSRILSNRELPKAAVVTTLHQNNEFGKARQV